MKDYFVVCMGGSGMRTAESLSYLISIGAFNNKVDNIHILLIDAHKLNKNLEQARKSISDYVALRDLFNKNNKCELFQPVVSLYEWDIMFDSQHVHSSGVNAITLNDMCAMDGNGNTLPSDNKSRSDAQVLMNALYSSYESERTVSQGYHAHPAIGAAFGSAAAKHTINNRSKISATSLPAFTDNLMTSLSSDETKLILCGSLFGGTGASSLSSMARFFKDYVEQKSARDLPKLKIGGVFMLPYFSFDGDPTTENPEIKQDKFAFATEKALSYYNNDTNKLLKSTPDGEGYYETIYMLGFDSPVPRSEYHDNDSQINPVHFVELEAAMAIKHYAEHGGRTGEVYMTGVNKYGNDDASKTEYYKLTWENFSTGKEFHSKTIAFVNMALLFNLYIYPMSFGKSTTRDTTFTPYNVYFKDVANSKTATDLLRSFFVNNLNFLFTISTSLVSNSVVPKNSSREDIVDERTQDLFKLDILRAAIKAERTNVEVCQAAFRNSDKLLLDGAFVNKADKLMTSVQKPKWTAVEAGSELTSMINNLYKLVTQKLGFFD